MKKLSLLALSLFLWLGALPAAAQTHIQQCQNAGFSQVTHSEFACTLLHPTGAGNQIVVGVTYGTNSTVSATDSQGNAYLLLCNKYDSYWNQAVAILWASNIAGGIAATVTVHFSSPVSYLALGVHEYAGLTGTDGCTGALGQSGTPASALTTTAPDLLFSIAVEDSVSSGISLTPPAGFTALENLATAAPTSAPYADAHSLQSLPLTLVASWTLSPSQSWISLLADFQAANTQPTLIAKLIYDDGTPVAGSAVLYLEGATETQVATAPLDASGKTFTTVAIDPTKSYRVVVDDTL